MTADELRSLVGATIIGVSAPDHGRYEESYEGIRLTLSVPNPDRHGWPTSRIVEFRDCAEWADDSWTEADAIVYGPELPPYTDTTDLRQYSEYKRTGNPNAFSGLDRYGRPRRASSDWTIRLIEGEKP